MPQILFYVYSYCQHIFNIIKTNIFHFLQQLDSEQLMFRSSDEEEEVNSMNLELLKEAIT